MTSGMNTPTAAAMASRGHQPTRSSARWASPRQPGRYSRRSPERATHSSTPTLGDSLGSTAILGSDHPRDQTFWSWTLPSRPRGRTIMNAIRIPNTIRFVNVEEM